MNNDTTLARCQSQLAARAIALGHDLDAAKDPGEMRRLLREMKCIRAEMSIIHEALRFATDRVR